MAINFACPHCGRRTLVSDEFAGQRGPCAGCGETIEIPADGRTVGTAVVAPRRGARGGMGWAQWLVLSVVLVLLGGVGWGIYSQVVTIERDALSTSCAAQLQAIGRALEQYHDDQGCYPPPYLADAEGKPQHSWRVLLLPYVGAAHVYERYRFDEAWNGPNNAQLLEEMPAVYGCPINPEGRTAVTSYVGLVGPGRLFEAGAIHRRSELDATQGDSLVVIEVCERAIPWLEPRDVTMDELSRQVNDFSRASMSSYHPRGAQGLTASGESVTVSGTLAARQLAPAFAGAPPKEADTSGESSAAPVGVRQTEP